MPGPGPRPLTRAPWPRISRMEVMPRSEEWLNARYWRLDCTNQPSIGYWIHQGNFRIEGNLELTGNLTDDTNTVTVANIKTAYDHSQVTHDYAFISGNDAATNVTAAELEELTDGSETTLHDHAGIGVDEKVKIDAAATAGYIGATSTDGVIRTTSPITYTDGGDYVTFAIDQSAIDHGTIGGLTDDDHTQYVLRQPTADTVINESGGDFDWRMEGATDANLFILNAGTNKIGIGVDPAYKFQVLSGNAVTCRLERSDSLTNTLGTVLQLKHTTDQDMADNFGVGFGFYIEDDTSGSKWIAGINGLRDGYDDQGRIEFRLALTGQAIFTPFKIDSDAIATIFTGGKLRGGVTHVVTHRLGITAGYETLLALRLWQDETVTVFVQQPEVPRNVLVRVEPGGGGTMTGTITINGKDADGNTIAEAFIINHAANTTIKGDRAFALITSVVADQTDITMLSRYAVGFGEKYGLPNYPFTSGDVFKMSINGADMATFIVNITYGTVDVSETHVTSAADIYTYWVRPYA